MLLYYLLLLQLLLLLKNFNFLLLQENRSITYVTITHVTYSWYYSIREHDEGFKMWVTLDFAFQGQI